MDTPYQRKPRMHFETVANASPVAFDDGTKEHLNLPWLACGKGRWAYAHRTTSK